MEDFHILTKAEISVLYQTRVKQYQQLVDAFISKKWDDKAHAPRYISQKLIRFLAITDKYNGTPVIEELLFSDYWYKLPDDQIEEVIDYHIRQLKQNDKTLSGTIQTGSCLREKVNPHYPSVFNGNDRLYIRLPLIKAHPARIEGILHDFNSCLSADQALSYQTRKITDTSYLISDKKNFQHIGVFLGRKVKMLDDLQAVLPTQTEQEQQHLLYQIRKRDFYQFSERDGHPIKVDWLKRDYHIALDPVLYRYLQQHLQQSSEPISKLVTTFKEKLSSLKNSILFEQERQGSNEYDALEHDTDLIILSKNPHDIAWCSAYTDYEAFSCMRPDGEMHQYVEEDIGRGTLVAYMLNSKQPLKRHSRILLKPYFNEHGEAIYYIGKTHGEKNYTFDRFLRQFARNYLNSPRTATYTIEKHLYPDSEPEKINYSHLSENTR